MNIDISNVHKRFNEKHILRGISLNIQRGEFVSLLGPSGCGKTTLLNLLAGLLTVDAGSIHVGGEAWSTPKFTRSPEQRRIGMVFQDFALWPHMSVFDNVAFGLKLQGSASADLHRRVKTVLEMVQMERYEQTFPHQLSGGQKQRIAIARALAPNPTIMLMDEPLSSLDAKLREQMRWDLLSLIREAGITTVYVTHDQVEALSMADRVVLMNEGVIEQSGTPTELYTHPETTFAATFVGASNILQGDVVATDASGITISHGNHRFRTQGEANVGSAVTFMIRPSDVQMRPAYADDVQAPLRTDVTASGVIIQRAFHGNHWQYRVQIAAFEERIEVWNSAEYPVGQTVYLTFPVHACQLVRDSKVLQLQG